MIRGAFYFTPLSTKAYGLRHKVPENDPTGSFAVQSVP